jgi:hypothetical protein
MSTLLEGYLKTQEKSFKHISKKGRIKEGFIDDFDVPIWVEKFGLSPIRCAPDYIEVVDGDEFAKKELEDVKPSESKKKGKKESEIKIYGIPIIKMKVTAKGIRNPITPEQVKAAYEFFKVPKDHFGGLKEIVISNELPAKKWAFGTYHIKKKAKELLENGITIWAQKEEMMNGELRYRVTPSNVSGPLFLTSSRFHYEILGDTAIHELGHHYDLWINEKPIGGTGWVARAENFAEKYTRSFTAIKRRSEEFLDLMTGYGEEDNKEKIDGMGNKDENAVQDIEMNK